MQAEIIAARSQKDKAVACAFLSLAIAAAVLVSNLGPDRPTEAARAAVLQHQGILAQNQSSLRTNEAALAQEMAALDKLTAPKGPAGR